MLEELVGLLTPIQEEEQRSFVYLLIQITSVLLVQPVHPSILPYMEQSMKLKMAHITFCMTTTSPVLFAMLPPELQ